MYTKILSQAPLQIVTLAQAKGQLNIIDDNEEDDHIQLLIDGSGGVIQQNTDF